MKTKINNNKNDNEQFTKIRIKPRMKRMPSSVITNKFNDNEYNYFIIYNFQINLNRD